MLFFPFFFVDKASAGMLYSNVLEAVLSSCSGFRVDIKDVGCYVFVPKWNNCRFFK